MSTVNHGDYQKKEDYDRLFFKPTQEEKIKEEIKIKNEIKEKQNRIKIIMGEIEALDQKIAEKNEELIEITKNVEEIEKIFFDRLYLYAKIYANNDNCKDIFNKGVKHSNLCNQIFNNFISDTQNNTDFNIMVNLQRRQEDKKKELKELIDKKNENTKIIHFGGTNGGKRKTKRKTKKPKRKTRR